MVIICDLTEIREISGRRQTFDHFLVWRASTSSRYSTGESPHIKAGHREFLPHLESTCTRFNTSARRRKRPSAVHERSHQLQIPPSLNSKAILQRVQLFFLQRQHWRAPCFFCCANIDGCLVFLLRQPWRVPSFSLAPTLLWTPTFSYAPSFYHPPKILGVPMFFECANVFCTYFSGLIFLYTFLQCCGSESESGSGSTGSTCFWASWIRIRIH